MSSLRTRTTTPTRSTSSGSSGSTDNSPGWYLWVWPALIILTGITLAAAGTYAGVTTVQLLADPGAVTRWGMPITKVLHNVSWSMAVGSLVFACGILPRWTGPEKQMRVARRTGDTTGLTEHPAYTRTVLIAQISTVVWTLSAMGQLVFNFSDLAGLPLNTSQGFTSGLFDYMFDIAVGQAWSVMTLMAAIIASLVFAFRTPNALAWPAAFSLIAIAPMALIGHSSSGDDHIAAVNSLGLHLLGVLLWVGGLFVLLILAPTLTRSHTMNRVSARKNAAKQPLLYTTLTRYSTLAGLSLFTVALSGIINANIRMRGLEDFLEPYGMMVLSKFVLTVALALVGLAHRRRVIPQLKTDGASTQPPTGATRLLWRLIAVEVLIMGVVMAVAVILGRTAPPVPEELPPNPTPARILTDYEMPPELTGARYFTEWRLDWLWVAIILFLAIWYVRSAHKLHQRGDKWSHLRTISFLVGLLILHWVTSGGPAVYGMVLFSAHMVAHMTLTMIAPLFLVLGAPITLALRATPARHDGTRGPREWMLALLNSWWAKFVTHPIFAAMNFAGSLLVFYYTPFFGFALDTHVGHEFMNFHFFLTGFIFCSVMVGIDPLPHRPNYPLRLVLLLATMVFHAFIGVSMTGSESLLEASWFSSLGRDWGPSAIEDQQIGGAIMWGIGEFPTVVMAIITVVQWRRHDMVVASRSDTRADKDGDAELEAWNQMFADMAARDEAREQSAPYRKDS